MAYLEKDDYSLRISVSNLNEILEQAALDTSLSEDNVRNNAESWAQATIKSYLVSNYNIAAEFALTGASRNFQIIQVMIDLSLCTLHKTINPRDIPEHIAIECENAVQWLKDVRDGKLVLSVGSADNASPGGGFQQTYLASQPKFISKPYQDLSLFEDDL